MTLSVNEMGKPVLPFPSLYEFRRVARASFGVENELKRYAMVE